MLPGSHSYRELDSLQRCSPSTRAAALAAMFLLVSFAVVSAQVPPVHDVTAAASPTAPAEVIPPTPTRWFSDYNLTVGPEFADKMNSRLERFEHETTNQFIVVIYPKMLSSAESGDYCTRVFNAWGVGRKGINNGGVLFVFLQDHKLYIRVGSGLQPPLTDAVCGQIVRTITASFRTGDYEGGLTAGVDAIVQTLQVQPPQHLAR